MLKTRLNLQKIGKITLISCLTVISVLTIINKTFAVEILPVVSSINGATYNTTDSTMIVNVIDQVANMNCSTFNLGANNEFRINYQSANQTLFARVTSLNPSSIEGKITQTGYAGNFFLINPNGILFGPKSSVNVGSFMASTLDINESDITNYASDSKLDLARQSNALPAGIVIAKGASVNVEHGIFLANGIKDYNSTSASNVSYITTDGVIFTVKTDNFVESTPVVSYTSYTGAETKTARLKTHPGIPITNSTLSVIPPTPPVIPLSDITSPLGSSSGTGGTIGGTTGTSGTGSSSLGGNTLADNSGTGGTEGTGSSGGSSSGLIAMNDVGSPSLGSSGGIGSTSGTSGLTPVGAAGGIYNVSNNTGGAGQSYDMVIDQAILP